MNPLALFYRNESERDAVKAFLISCLGELAVERTFDKKDVSGIADAKDVIESAFNKLEEQFAEKKPPLASNSR